MATLSNILGAKKGKKGQIDYHCDLCDFVCSKKYSWDRHILTSKHQLATNSNNLATEKGQNGQNEQNESKLSCDKCNNATNVIM